MIFADIDPSAWVDAWNKYAESNPKLAESTTYIAYALLAAAAIYLVIGPFVEKVLVPMIWAIRGIRKKDGE